MLSIVPRAPRIPPDEVPQANDLNKVRTVLDAIREGAVSTSAISAMTGISPRHVAYALSTARALDLLASKPKMRLLERGLALCATRPGSQAELDHFRDAIESSRVVRRLVPGGLFGASGPRRDDLARRIASASRLSTATATRRAQTLLSWRRQLLKTRLLPIDVREDRRPASPPSPPRVSLPAGLELDLRRNNPWWAGQPGVRLPTSRRDFVGLIERRLRQNLAPIVVVRGPRQVGKTTAQNQVIEKLLRDERVPATHIIRVQFDDLPSIAAVDEPILRIVDWYEATVLGKTLNEAAAAGESTYLFFDEVQNLPDWAVQLKALVDSSTTQVVVTGSSALRIEQGRDSLAGRITSIEVGTLSLREIAVVRFGAPLDVLLGTDSELVQLADPEFWRALVENGERQRQRLEPVFEAFSERGGYPMVHARANVPWSDVADQLNETVIRRVIGHDLRVGERGRKRDAALLEEVLRLACRYAGQSPNVQTFAKEIQRALNANVGSQRIRQYLEFLDRTLLLRLIRPLEIRLKKTRGAAKLCLADHGLRASWLQEVVPLSPTTLERYPHLLPLAGHVAESAVGAFFATISGLDVAHFPARPEEPEVDFVLTVGAHRIPVEVKYRTSIDARADTQGLRSFLDRTVYNAPVAVLVTQKRVLLNDPRIVAVPLDSLLLLK